ncbi:NeuD/PglB/VioB family sugar acetyltransferase [Gelidibacter salicanalis]|uniref:NeuD/PglB/VioB family sugar acetyltransferase n=1 Tax=Gelidibacter salicanalis TaxID=291193 RepID=A0A934KZU6_9FLAO|nr:NeuD/PglB/VioB family sugar acetyltransferase [Gelidibacter salicanalis]MBJ7882700.1 NeuD/PglB/VioB family sugar acetyltransferase [Gelidibacter salicanalis]
MKKAIIIGAGTHGQIYASYLKEAGVDVIGFIDDDDSFYNKKVIGIKVLGKYEDLFNSELKDLITDVYCPIGDNFVRQDYLSSLKKEGYNTPSFVHRTVCVGPDVTLGEAHYMLPGNYIMPHTTIGDYFMVNMGTTIGHHVKIKNGVFMSSGIHIGASLEINDMAYFGIGSIVKTGVQRIGVNSLIGAGSVIFKDVPDYAVMAGNPARVIKLKEINEKTTNH